MSWQHWRFELRVKALATGSAILESRSRSNRPKFRSHASPVTGQGDMVGSLAPHEVDMGAHDLSQESVGLAQVIARLCCRDSCMH